MVHTLKRSAFLACMLFLALAVAAWAGASKEGSAGTAAGGGATEGTKATRDPNLKLTLARVLDTGITAVGFKSYNEAPGFLAWQKQSGITVECIEPADGPALLLMLSSGTYPDIITGTKNFYPGGPAKMLKDGIIIDLADKLSQYAPDYLKFLSSKPYYMNAVRESDGSILAFAGYSFEEGSPFRSWLGGIVRKEMLDQLKISAPETVDEYYQMLTRMKNELKVPIPLIWTRNYTTNALANGLFTSPFGLVAAGEYQIDGKYHFGAYEPQYKDALAWMNKLYVEGLLDKNFAVTDEATAQGSMIKGNSGAMVTAASRIAVMTRSAASDSFHLVGIKSLVRTKGQKAMFGYADPYLANSYWLSITTKCKDVPAAMEFLNYVFTEKGNILYNYGTEGVSFTYVDGKPKLTELITKAPSLDNMLRAYALLNWHGTHMIGMSQQRFPLQEQVDAYRAWSNNDTDRHLVVNNSIAPEFVDENAKLIADIDTYVAEMRAKFISGEEPLSGFDQYLANLKRMGMDRLLEIRQKSYDLYNRK